MIIKHKKESCLKAFTIFCTMEPFTVYCKTNGGAVAAYRNLPGDPLVTDLIRKIVGDESASSAVLDSVIVKLNGVTYSELLPTGTTFANPFIATWNTGDVFRFVYFLFYASDLSSHNLFPSSPLHKSPSHSTPR